MKPDPYKKDLVIRKSYSKDHGNWRKSKLKVDISDPDNMVDIKHTVSTKKIGGFWGSNSWINWRYMTRFIQAHVGEPFDEVYSKLCKMADDRSWTGATWRKQITDRELIHPAPCEERKDGLYTLEGHRVQGSCYSSRSDYYVDANGILRATTKAIPPAKNRYKYFPPKKEVSSVKINKNTFLIKSEGVWWQVETKDLSYIENDPNKLKLLHQLSADLDKDILLYHRYYSPVFKEKFLSYRWEELLRKTYCGELRVGISKQYADHGLCQQLGLVVSYGTRGYVPLCTCNDPDHCGLKHQNLMPKKEREANKQASLEALMKLFE